MAERVAELVAEVFSQEIAEATAAGTRGYMGRVFVQTTMPHKRSTENYVERRNGTLAVRMTATTSSGLPYGTPPRHILAWVTTEAVRTRSRQLDLGDSFGAWLAALDVHRGGQNYRTYQRGMASLFGTAITAADISPGGLRLASAVFAERADLWWDPKSPDQLGLWQSSVTLSASLYDSIVDRPVPVDLQALRILGRSPLALDLYTWLTYRMSYLRAPVTIPWEALHAQFGTDYARLIDFRRKAIRALQKVVRVYPEVRIEASCEGLHLAPSRTHIHQRVSPKK